MKLVGDDGQPLHTNVQAAKASPERRGRYVRLGLPSGTAWIDPAMVTMIGPAMQQNGTPVLGACMVTLVSGVNMVLPVTVEKMLEVCQ